MRQRGRRAWDLIGCGGLILLMLTTEIGVAVQHGHGPPDFTFLAAVGPYVALGIILVVAGLFGRTWQARWRSRR
ncbi:MAG TPA: hypothetical protein VGF55_31870 [Gemmataceae bacterium]|jgi:hypothetical protein